MPSTFRVPNTNFYRAPGQFQSGHADDLEAFGRWAADQIAVAIEQEGPDTVAAVFLEPVQNAGGCFPPPPGYFARVREICDPYDVLLVSDEVICAFGRLGHMFGAERYGYVPDMITCAKGLTSGYSPLGAMITSDRLMEPFLHGTESVPARLHLRWAPGLDRGGHGQPRRLRTGPRQRARPSQRGRLPSHAGAAAGPAHRRATSAATATSTASNWSRTPTTKETFDADESERLLRGFLSKALFDAGLYCRADDRGDPVIQLAPPLICDQSHFDEMEAALRSVLTEAQRC